MKLQAWIYVLPMAGRDTGAVIAQVAEMKAALDPLLERGVFAGWRIFSLLTDDDFDDKDVDREFVEPITGGELPAVFLNITYDLERNSPGDPQVEAFLDRTGLVHSFTDPPVSD
ncbi:hypothetical protein [Paractinoplanes rishiriensis]|uniref:Uncharacterized protein n=1 Tax=Paractinoplanes rishiriensis TaxID=1050105 RepID=A0A919JTV8_9ACTN|nr:hypothetical protein [Actinoplanes rishiriensis]GIE94710.1 hypothetical protein Ari01nite_21750 [Actinoplanes rishiriensis]